MSLMFRSKLKIREKALIKAINEYLGLRENLKTIAWYTRLNSGLMWGLSYKGKGRAVRLARKGSPDFVGCRSDGRFFAIEAKGSDGRLTIEQSIVLNQIQAAGGIAVVAHSIEEAARALS